MSNRKQRGESDKVAGDGPSQEEEIVKDRQTKFLQRSNKGIIPLPIWRLVEENDLPTSAAPGSSRCVNDQPASAAVGSKDESVEKLARELETGLQMTTPSRKRIRFSNGHHIRDDRTSEIDDSSSTIAQRLVQRRVRRGKTHRQLKAEPELTGDGPSPEEDELSEENDRTALDALIEAVDMVGWQRTVEQSKAEERATADT